MSHQVDVLIPVFNAAATVRQALHSIQEQKCVNLRIIVVDDGSTDATPDILIDVASRDNRISILTQMNGGIVSALNSGLAQASAPLIARHDSDDLADPGRLSRQITYLDNHADCVAVSSYARHILADGTPTSSVAKFRPAQEADPYALPSWEPYLLHPFLVVRKAAIDLVKGYRNVLHAEDTDLYWRLQAVGRLHVIPETLGSYRLGNESISSRSIHNGRLLALFSQLAAISHRRRLIGSPDFDFDIAWVGRIAGLKAPSAMLAAATERTNLEESTYLYAAFSAKLLELTSYRPYELESEDCKIIQSVLDKSLIPISVKNRRDLARSRAIAVARLARGGRLNDALRLCSLKLFPESMARLLLRRC